jgi:molybdopterin converting factor small subunit
VRSVQAPSSDRNRLHAAAPMKIRVLLFGPLAEQAGAGPAPELELPEGSRAGDVLAAVAERLPRLAPSLASAALAVNAAYVRRDAPLRDGDVVALLPPVSGG